MWPVRDRAAWQLALQPAAFLASGGMAAAWSDAGRRMVTNSYGRWLGWLAQTHQLDPEQRPEQRVTPERAHAYAQALAKTNAPMTVQGRIGQLGRAMRALAPDGDWRWLSQASDRLRADAVPVREKRARMQEVNDLVELGARLMLTATRTDDHFAIQRAGLYRDGLIIALLALRPLRLRTFAAITLGQHLNPREEAWWLCFGAADTKTKQPMEMPFPAALVPALESYLEHYRPVLFTGKPVPGRVRPATDALWIARGGQMMGKDAIRFQVTTHTDKAFGQSVHPHLFRDCAATTIAIEDPEHVRIIAQILGHSNSTTAEKHYNQAGTLEASLGTEHIPSPSQRKIWFSPEPCPFVAITFDPEAGVARSALPNRDGSALSVFRQAAEASQRQCDDTATLRVVVCHGARSWEPNLGFLVLVQEARRDDWPVMFPGFIQTQSLQRLRPSKRACLLADVYDAARGGCNRFVESNGWRPDRWTGMRRMSG